MKRWLLAANAVCLAACSGAPEEPVGPKAGDPGTYTRNLGDGTPVALIIREDGSLLRKAGKQVTTGTATVDGDEICFSFANEPGEQYCWTNGPIRPGGTFESTGPNGESLTLTYSPELPPRGVSMTPGVYDVGDETTAYGRTEIKADGTYTDFTGGEAVGGGSWTSAGERVCFDPEGDEDHQRQRCWINSEADEAGRFLTTREDGSESYFVTPVKG